MKQIPLPHPADERRDRLSRRLMLAGIAGALGAAAIPATGAAIAAAPTTKLPGEIARTVGNVTQVGKVMYDAYTVSINGDRARLFIPQSLTLFVGQPVQVAWFYHGAGSDHTALDGGFKADGQRAVDAGLVAICQNAGGTQYSNPKAQSIAQAGYQYLRGLFDVRGSVLRATSGGGALACETYGSALIPDIIGLYMMNAIYDLRKQYETGANAAGSIDLAFGGDQALIDACNPARLPAAVWTGCRLRILVSQPSSTDTSVPPDVNGIALYQLASPVGTSVVLRGHDRGHATPTWEPSDWAATLASWVPPLPPWTPSPTPSVSSAPSQTPTATATPPQTPSATPTPTQTPTPTAPADTIAPTVRFTSPSGSSATVRGVATVKASATDNVGVVGVNFYWDDQLIGPGTYGGGVWSLTVDTNTNSTPNGVYRMIARAYDAAGNVGISSPVTITIKN